MKRNLYFSFFLILVFSLPGRAQSSAQKDAIIRKKMDSLMRIKTKVSDTLGFKFLLDTSRIEITEEVYLEDELNDFAMRDLSNQAGRSYDELLNKYYKKLSGKLNETNRAVLVRTQKAWIAYRDEELKLFGTIDEASNGGGGTAATIALASIYRTLTKQRTIDLFNYYRDLINHY
jgi:uncharacterized protein YecT (DUF1311 family)